MTQLCLGHRYVQCNATLLRKLGNCVGAVEDKLVYQLSVDEGNRHREVDNS